MSRALSALDRKRIKDFVAQRLAMVPADLRGHMRYALVRSAIVILREADERAREAVER